MSNGFLSIIRVWCRFKHFSGGRWRGGRGACTTFLRAVYVLRGVRVDGIYFVFVFSFYFFNIILKTSTNHIALASNVLRDSRAAFLGELNGWTFRQECHRHAFHCARHAPVGLGRPIRHCKRNDKSSLLYAFRGVHHMTIVFISNDIFSKI